MRVVSSCLIFKLTSYLEDMISYVLLKCKLRQMSRNFFSHGVLCVALGLTLRSQLAFAQLSFIQLDQLSANDKDFIEFAGEFDLTAVRLGSMAQTKGSTAEVKSLGRTLEQEHGADLKKLTAIANKTGGVAPNTLDDVHVSAIKKLSKAKGDTFDHQFLKMVVNEHENALVSVKREADHGASPDLQAYAKALLPHLEHHLKQARKQDLSSE